MFYRISGEGEQNGIKYGASFCFESTEFKSEKFLLEECLYTIYCPQVLLKSRNLDYFEGESKESVQHALHLILSSIAPISHYRI